MRKFTEPRLIVAVHNAGKLETRLARWREGWRNYLTKRRAARQLDLGVAE